MVATKQDKSIAKQNRLIDKLKTAFEDQDLRGYDFKTTKKGTQLVNADEKQPTTLNARDKVIEKDDVFRQLNAVLGSPQKRQQLFDAVKSGQRADGYKISNGKLMYDKDDLKRIVPITREDIEAILEQEHKRNGTGKGIMVFYKHIQSKYLGITRNDVSNFLKTKQQYVLSRPTPHKTNKPIVAKSLNEIWSIDLIDMERPPDDANDDDDDDDDTPDVVGGSGTRKSSRVSKPSRKIKDNASQAEEKKQLAINEERMKKADIEKRGYRWIFTCVEVFSRKVWLVPMKGKSTKFCTLPALKDIIQRAEVKPRHIIVDNGMEFEGHFKSFCKDEGIKIRATRTYSPQANGVVEAENKQVRRLLNELLIRDYTSGDEADPEWHEYLPEVENLRNNSYRNLLKETPNNVFYSVDNNNVATYGNILLNAFDRMEKYKETEYNVGDSVFVAMKTIYSKIRKVYKAGNQKSLAYIYHPVILEIFKAGRRNALQRKRYAVREKYDKKRILCHPTSLLPVYVYSSDLHKATIDRNDITVSAEEALYMNEVDETPRNDLIWITDEERMRKLQKKTKVAKNKKTIVGDGYKFEMKTIDTQQPIFSGDLEQHRCEASTTSGEKCRRMVTIGLPYCFQHRKTKRKVKTATSGIRDAGRGLFAFQPRAKNGIVFRKDDVIAKYIGEYTTRDETNLRYGTKTAPYALEISPTKVIDASLKRGLGSLANSKRLKRDCNAKLTATAGAGYLKATKNIRHGEEIYVYYGNDYEFDTEHSTKYVRPHKKID